MKTHFLTKNTKDPVTEKERERISALCAKACDLSRKVRAQEARDPSLRRLAKAILEKE